MLNNIFQPYHTMQEMNLDWILTKVKNILRFVPDDGAVGQILRRTAHGAEWSNEQGGGGAVDSVNGQTGTVVLDKVDIGLGNVDNVQQYSASNPPPYPVSSVNGQTGTVVLGKSDIGLGNVDNVQQYSATNPPPYPVTSVNGQTGAVTLSIPTDVSDLNNDSGFVDAAGAAAAAPVQSVNGQTGAVVLTIPSILSKAINSATDGTGDINLLLYSTQYMPIGFVKTSPLDTFFVYSFAQSANGQTWWMKLLNDSAGNLANTSISGTLYYIEV